MYLLLLLESCRLRLWLWLDFRLPLMVVLLELLMVLCGDVVYCVVS